MLCKGNNNINNNNKNNHNQLSEFWAHFSELQWYRSEVNSDRLAVNMTTNNNNTNDDDGHDDDDNDDDDDDDTNKRSKTTTTTTTTADTKFPQPPTPSHCTSDTESCLNPNMMHATMLQFGWAIAVT
ncbi:unnamed protein product [Polarella glacialis]|uniref:Uncharacterized protein n=1 Tax=Polarella glacialis TaxID=89957 RepID=A0A813JLT3_POLGL|nr:unnamed protein product [Polarella glacialis]